MYVSSVPATVQGVPLGFQQLTSLSTATPLLPPPGATLAVVEADTDAVRWRDDGVAPTASIGMSIAAAGYALFYGNLSVLQFIAVTGSPVLNVSYYR